MSNGGYIGVNGVARRLSKIYLGDENGVAQKVTKGYIGDANGVARLFYTAHTHSYLSNNDYYFDDDVSTTQHFYTKSCSCGETITVDEEHNYVYRYREPSCTESGFEQESCHCGKTLRYVSIPTTEHIAGAEATCYADQICTVCRTVLVRAHHTEEIIDEVAPTCIDKGWTRGVKCSVCGEILASPQNTIPALGHDYYEHIVEPTCTERGYTLHTCTRCGAGHSDTYVPELGHDYQKTSSVAATCGADGYDVYTCSRCGDSYRETTQLATGNHVYDSNGKCFVCGATSGTIG